MSEWDKTDHPEILSEQTILISMSCRDAGMLIAAASDSQQVEFLNAWLMGVEQYTTGQSRPMQCRNITDCSWWDRWPTSRRNDMAVILATLVEHLRDPTRESD